MMRSELPQIALIQAGGTIISMGVDRLDFASYGDTQQRLSAAQLVEHCPDLAHVAEITTIDFRQGGSRTLVMQDWLLLLAKVTEVLAADGCEGVVITHGTNSLEETAYFLHLTVGDPRPVVLAGAMRPPNTLGSDADLNLLNAFRVAVDPGAVDLGVLVAMNGTIHSARDVVKSTTYGLDSFRSRDWGPIGFTGADGRNAWSPHVSAVAPRTPAFDPDLDRPLARVDVVVSHVGADGTFVDASVRAGAGGIVSAGTGAGVTTLAEEAALVRAAAEGVVVCQSTRVAGGSVLRTRAMERLGFVAGGDLPPWKARILLSLALGRTCDVDQIQQLFDQH